MHKIKYMMPIVINILICIVYKIFTRKELRYKLDGDVLLYIDGRIEYNFGIGSVSVIVIFAILLITVSWILWNARHYFSGRMRKLYLWISITFVLMADVMWLKHYYDLYLSGLPEYIIRPALEQLL